MNNKIDDLLKEALAPSKKPDAWLNQDILRKAMEGNNMKKPFFKTVPIMTVVLTAVLATGSLTAYGAWQYLNPEQPAKKQIEKWEKELEGGSNEDNGSFDVNTDEMSLQADELDWEELEKVTLIKGTVKKYPASKFHGQITYLTDVEWNGMTFGEMLFSPDEYFDKDEYGTKIIDFLGGDNEKGAFSVMKRSKDGTITVCMYHN